MCTTYFLLFLWSVSEVWASPVHRSAVSALQRCRTGLFTLTQHCGKTAAPVNAAEEEEQEEASIAALQHSLHSLSSLGFLTPVKKSNVTKLIKPAAFISGEKKTSAQPCCTETQNPTACF